MVPNLNITFNSGQPNQPAKFNIRGNTSLNGGNALILVDGSEISDLSLINPQDVENISVLKDASSAAIYGARAAFGVILVTTKRGGRNDKPVINYNTNFSWNTPARLPEVPRSDVFCETFNRMFEYNGSEPFFTDKFMDLLRAHLNDPEHNPDVLVDIEGIQSPRYTPTSPGWAYVGNTDWIHEFYKKSALMQQHNASVSGGNGKTDYYFSLGYKDQEGLFRYGDDTYNRLNLTMNVDTQVYSWLKLSASVKYNNTKSDEPYTTPLGGSVAKRWSYGILRMFPNQTIYLPNGDFAGMNVSHGVQNIIGEMANAGRYKKDIDDFWYIGKMELKPFKDFTINADYSINKYYYNRKIHQKVSYQTWPTGREPSMLNFPNGVTESNNKTDYNAFNIWAEYKKEFESGHQASLLVGYNQEKKHYTGNGVTVENLIDNNLPLIDMATLMKSTDEYDTAWAIQGIFMRANYNYKNRYLFDFNARYDGSSKYAKDDRWGFFPSFSGAWRISEEKFFAPVKPVIDELKVRATYGMLGNQVTGGKNFQYIGVLEAKDLNYIIDGKLSHALLAPSLPNLVTWEKVISKNIGLDWALFNNRLTGSFDWYIRDTKDMVRSKTYPAVLGTSSGQTNIADMRTKGFELTLGWRDRINDVLGSDFGYSLNLGLSDYQAEITKIDNPTNALGNYRKGQKLGEIWGYETEGFIKDQAEANQMNVVQGFFSKQWYPGEIRYKDLDGNGIIDNGNLTADNPGDRKIIGNNTPRYKYNIQTSLNWHNFSLDVLFEGVGKRDIWIGSDQFWGFSRDIYNASVTQYHIDNTWTYDHTDAFFPRPAPGSQKSYQVQTKYLQNAAYIRLKNLTLSYTVPRKYMDKLHIQNLRFYVSGMNLWEHTHLLPFLNPDIVDNVISSGQTSSNTGKEYVFMRNYSCGVSITF